MGKQHDKHPFEDDPFLEGLASSMDSAEGELSSEVLDAAWMLLEKVDVDSKNRKIIFHMGVIRAMWDDCEEYKVGDKLVRRVFRNPQEGKHDPANPFQFNLTTGTTDLDWCNRVMAGDYLKKAGWGKHMEDHPQYPLLIDTGIFARHINPDGEQFP